MAEIIRKPGAAVLLRYVHDMILFLRDDKETISNPLRWSVLAGAIEPGETADQAIAREILEEFGTQIEVTLLGVIGTNTWYTASVSGQQFANMSRGEGCGDGKFSFAGLKSMAQFDCKLSLGGAIRRFVLEAPDQIEAFLERGKEPDLEKLQSKSK